jgi:hypothetical protein
MVADRKTGNISVDELNGETGVDWRIGGGHRRSEGARIVCSGAGVGGSKARVGGGRLDTEKGFLTLGNVQGDGESTENGREEDEGACSPHGCRDGGGCTALEGGRVGLGSSDNIQEPRTLLALGRHRSMSGSHPAGTFFPKVTESPPRAIKLGRSRDGRG